MAQSSDKIRSLNLTSPVVLNINIILKYLELRNRQNL